MPNRMVFDCEKEGDEITAYINEDGSLTIGCGNIASPDDWAMQRWVDLSKPQVKEFADYLLLLHDRMK